MDTNNTQDNAAATPVDAATPAVTSHPEALKNLIKNFDTLIDIAPTKFSFKKKEDEVDEITGDKIVGTKRPTLELDLPVLSYEGILKLFEKVGKELELVKEAVNDVIIARARQIINDDESISSETFPYNDITWEVIANLPKAERRGGGISKEMWEGFIADYMTIMPAAANKTQVQVERAAKVFAKKLVEVKTDKVALKLLLNQLTIYINNSPQAEQFEECVSFLVNKANTLLDKEQSSLVENL